MLTTPNASRLPPHLGEVCAILAAGLVRLLRNTARELDRDGGRVGADADVSLHFHSDQSGHATATLRRDA
jgi:hypothetical protein